MTLLQRRSGRNPSLTPLSPHDLVFNVGVSRPDVPTNPLGSGRYLFHNPVFWIVGALFNDFTEKRSGLATKRDVETSFPLTRPPASMVPSSCVDSQLGVSPYPGSDLSIPQLLAALDQKMPAEIAWLESNARSRGVLVHFRKPEV